LLPNNNKLFAKKNFLPSYPSKNSTQNLWAAGLTLKNARRIAMPNPNLFFR
jgi:hypothetical protein